MENKLAKLYKILKVIIYIIPVITVVVGVYLVIFPVEDFRYYSDQPKQSKFDITKNETDNTVSFGAFPQGNNHRFIDMNLDLKKTQKKSCLEQAPNISLQITYPAFLYREGDPITTADQLKELLFADNATKYPNGTLLHSKATNEVFLISHGKRILFPGPEIFTAFGFSFNNLVEADQSAIDQFPEADKRVLLWSSPHPDGVIFQSFPSHSLYLILNGEKRKIPDIDTLKNAWPENYTIPVNDSGPENHVLCQSLKGNVSNGTFSCRFDSRQLPPALGKFFQFSVEFPEKCSVQDVHPNTAQINFISDKSYATVKDSIRNIFASILSRYLRNKVTP